MDNKFKIIETEDYFLAISDKEIKENEQNITNGRVIFNYSDFSEYSLEYANNYWEKIIAYLPKNNAKELDSLPLLPEIIVEDNVEKLNEIEQLLTNITEWSSFKEHPIGF